MLVRSILNSKLGPNACVYGSYDGTVEAQISTYVLATIVRTYVATIRSREHQKSHAAWARCYANHMKSSTKGHGNPV